MTTTIQELDRKWLEDSFAIGIRSVMKTQEANRFLDAHGWREDDTQTSFLARQSDAELHEMIGAIREAHSAPPGLPGEPMFNPFPYSVITSVMPDEDGEQTGEVIRTWPPRDFDIHWSTITEDELDALMARLVKAGQLEVAQVLADKARANGYSISVPSSYTTEDRAWHR